MSTLNVGRFAFSASSLLLFGALLVSLAVAWYIRRRRRVDVEPQLWLVLAVGLLVARLAFVAPHLDLYRESPWSFLNVRDGGFAPAAGLVAALSMAGLAAWWAPEKRKALGLAVAAGATVWLLGMAAMAGLEPAPMALPSIAFKRLDGSAMELKGLAGRPMVVNMWASWCPPCRNEMPILRDAQARRKDVAFVFVDQGEDVDTVRKYLDTEHLALDNVLLDSTRELARLAGSQALPTTLFFNEKGMLVDRRIGERSVVTLAQRLESLRPSK
jgi:thiol-disulfide isomerase/thioredoxin